MIDETCSSTNFQNILSLELFVFPIYLLFTVASGMGAFSED